MNRPKSQARSSTKERATARLAEDLERKLLSYATAATAAGVGMLACSLPAEAKIVFTSIFVEIAPKALVNLDLNGDGIADFQFSNNSSSGTSGGLIRRKLHLIPQNQRNAIWGGTSRGFPIASALAPGVVVGPKGKFQQGAKLMATAGYGFGTAGPFYTSYGPWREATHSYLGLRFTIGGQTHFGWARLNVASTAKGVYAAVTGYAYETVPNKPIVTGKTSGSAKNRTSASSNPASSNGSKPASASLGLLAYGSLGLDAWRRRNATLL
jgi:hypothetical protein